ncbi:hypothetical protein BO78DRAFT_384407 [Aspergillus sclerotiicarbonarius CBS 121057]|uniref:TPR-like protein n=1 Tax=Aspergillus sclerotiicarbonarius (strain CBS 121057 / IBT 28362) TaxID=1448318 RepID=A0A319EFZ5_ASPSB|nr:hypothetical protein BO78DRAFT_384407 [Aspergillus sclerotiicarbonarius CBS 121057]
MTKHTPQDYPNYNLGPLRHPITTTSPTAQLWFDRGLLWTYAFNHEEAHRCFTLAAEHDPTCAMAHWGKAYTIGPSYNKQWAFFDESDLHSSIQTAHSALSHPVSTTTTPLEQALQTALLARFPPPNTTPPPPHQMSPYNHAYAAAMRPLYTTNPTNLLIASLFIESLLCISPRALWDLDTGAPTGPHTTEARTLLESFLSTPETRSHPAICHLYIHLMEMTTTPELALPAADRLRTLMPDASHILHMPTHIDMAVGDYRRAIDSSQEAILADDKFFTSGGGALYIAYRVHNIMTKMYCALISGRMGDAVTAAEKLDEVIDERVLGMKSPAMADWTEGFLGQMGHVYVRFGKWEEILKLEVPGEGEREVYCCKTANLLYARGIALSGLGRVEEAEEARRAFEEARKKVPESRFSNVPVRQREVLGVASAMLEGEVEYRKGNVEGAFAVLRRAVRLEDGLPYCDPPAWTQPVRHALGGLLLEQGRVEEAERVFREDLGIADGFPRRKARLGNVWGLHGLHECLVKLGKWDEARGIAVQRDVALGSADVPITTSCYCRLSAVGKCC